jgi:DNA repair photolyase
MAKLKEISCKSAITWQSNYSYLFRSLWCIRSWQSLKYLTSSLLKSSKARVSTKTYNLNPYIGCTHKCVYCYAEYQKGFRHFGQVWGDFVDVKNNLPEMLKTQIKGLSPGEVFLGSISDAYQPVEGKYKLSRKALEILLSSGFGVTVLTKSAMVTRDVDILANPRCKVGLSITVLDDGINTMLEPGASRTSERLAALHMLKDRGVNTWAYIAPILPTFTDNGDDIERLVEKLGKCGVSFVASDGFNPFPSSWVRFSAFLKQTYPERIKRIRNIIFSDRAQLTAVQERIKRACENNHLTYHSERV